MKRILPLLLLGVATNVAANGSSNMITLNQVYVQPGMIKLNGPSSSTDTAFVTQIGYNLRLSPEIALDGSYFTAQPMSGISSSVDDELLLDGFTLAAKFTFPVNYYGAIYMKMGMNHTNINYRYADNNQFVRENSSDTNVYAGIGTSMQIRSNTALNLEYQFLQLDSSYDASMLSVGINFMF